MSEQKLCPDCGEPMHVVEREVVEVTFTFSAPMYEAMEKMAARRKESVEQLLFHLLWLESAKVPAARKLLEGGHHE